MNRSLYFMLTGQDVFFFCKYDNLIPLFTQESVICWNAFVLPARFINPFWWSCPENPRRMPVAFRRAKFLLALFNKSLKSHSALPSVYIHIYMREKLFMLWLHQTEAPNGPSPESFRCFRHIHMVKSQQKTFMSWDKTRNQNCWHCKTAKAPL